MIVNGLCPLLLFCVPFTVGRCSSEQAVSMWLRILQLKVIEEKLNSQLIALFRTNLILIIII